MRPTDEVQGILNAAYHEAKNKGHEYITPEHLLYTALGFDDPRFILESCDADPDVIRENLEGYFAKYLQIVKGTEPMLTEGWQDVIERTLIHLSSAGKEELSSADLLVALFDLDDSYASYYLQNAGVSRIRLLELVSHSISGT